MASGIFPHSWDGGIPPNPETPDNPPQAWKPGSHTQPQDTSALYYGLGCDTRIRAPVMNSIISEIICVLEYAGIPYRAGLLTNLATAVALIAQRAGAPASAPVIEPARAVVPVTDNSVISLKAELFNLHAEIDALKKDVAALKVSRAILANAVKEKAPA